MILEGTALAGSLVAWMHTKSCLLAYNIASDFSSASQEMMKNLATHCLRIFSERGGIRESNYLKRPQEEKVGCQVHISLLTVALDVTGCVPS